MSDTTTIEEKLIESIDTVTDWLEAGGELAGPLNICCEDTNT